MKPKPTRDDLIVGSSLYQLTSAARATIDRGGVPLNEYLYNPEYFIGRQTPHGFARHDDYMFACGEALQGIALGLRTQTNTADAERELVKLLRHNADLAEEPEAFVAAITQAMQQRAALDKPAASTSRVR